MSYIILSCFFLYVRLINAGPFHGQLCGNSTTSSCTQPKCPASASCLIVHWIEFPPYAYEINGDVKGVIPEILPYILNDCCVDCWKLNLTQIVDPEQLTKADVFFPTYWDGSQTYKNMYYVSLIANPSFVYVTKKPETSGIPGKLVGAVWDSWPVLVIALLLSLHAGVLIWFLEFWRNAEQFPASFTRGAGEGFWWAFVSMTTVGYGDRAPQSLLGRGFAVFWILIGICICSIFTATLTTSLTTISLVEKKELSRAKVGAHVDSLETVIGVEHQAKVVEFNSTDKLLSALSNNLVEGVIIDSAMSAIPYYQGIIGDQNLRISQTVTSDKWSYGLFVKDKDFAECLSSSFRSYSPNFVSDLLVTEIESDVTRENEATERSSSIFDPTGDVFWPSLYTCIAITVAIVVFGLLWELVLLPKVLRKTAPSQTALGETRMPDIDSMEKEIIAEVQGLFSKWRQNMNEIGIQQHPDVIELS